MAKEIDGEKTLQAEHSRITEDMRERIRVGFWAIGSMIPGRRDLAKEYRASAATLERAIVPLLADGTLIADNRRGTFVAKSSVLSASAHDEFEIIRPAYRIGHIGIVASLYDEENSRGGANDYWVRQLMDSIERDFSANGRTVKFCNRIPRHGTRPIPLAESIAEAVSAQPAAIIVIILDLSPKMVNEALERVGSLEIPIICIVTGDLERPVSYVAFDNVRAGYLAGKHLIDLGHREIAIFAPTASQWSADRVTGVKRAVEHAGMSQESLRIFAADGAVWDYYTEERPYTYQLAHAALHSGWTPRGGVICTNDRTAIDLIDVLQVNGFTAGADFALVGFDDHPTSRARGLTTFKPPIVEIGKEAARLAQQVLTGAPSISSVRFQPHLMKRSTTSEGSSSENLSKHISAAHDEMVRA